ncbi:hypothetical protein TNCV_710811 [Trichonephila clavipes]|nr:hypothetical protein TNCV_710811 [Trichonephila clavipes]
MLARVGQQLQISALKRQRSTEDHNRVGRNSDCHSTGFVLINLAHTHVFYMTLHRRLRERNLHPYRALSRLPLSSVHHQVQLQWCRAR